MVVLKENSCRACRKVFCCSDCRDAHESKKHPKPTCSLCAKHSLPFRISEDLDSSTKSMIITHLVITHLPVYCKLCGQKYTNSQELESAGYCTWWEKTRKREKRFLVQPIDTPCINEIKTELATEIEQKLPHTPLFIDNNDSEHKYLRSGSLILTKQDNFDSPPETLVRHTSTPMHAGPPSVLLNQKPKGNISAISKFTYKTPPSSLNHLKRTFNSTGSVGNRSGYSSSSSLESRYYTGIESPMRKLNLESTNIGCNQSLVDSPLHSILKKTFDPYLSATDINDNESPSIRKLDPRLMKPGALERLKMNSPRDSIEKRVRFSNQHLGPTSSACEADSSAYFADNDIFFEARETLDESFNVTSNVDVSKEQEEINTDIEKTSDKPEDEKKQVLVTCDCHCQNTKNVKQKESSLVEENNNNVDEKSVQNVQKSSVCALESSKSIPPVSTMTSTSSSRVVMMLLVEKTDDSKGFSNLDLGPLIDSGLKKLEESTASVTNSSNINKSPNSCRRATEVTTEVTSFTHKIDGSRTEHSISKNNSPAIAGSTGVHAIKASIKDSFVSISDRVECFTPPTRRRKAHESDVSQDQEQELSHKADNITGNPNKSDGLFSVVARVVRSALQKLPAVGSVTSRNVSREPMSQSICSPVDISSSSSSSHISNTEVTLQRSASKRRRERADSIDDQNQPPYREYPGYPNRSSSPVRTDLVVHSPAAKRHRGWYRIRGREPIARMRQITSPRGTSLETQRFQQGALSVGDTFIPLPSRAHQSTQTED